MKLPKTTANCHLIFLLGDAICRQILSCTDPKATYIVAKSFWPLCVSPFKSIHHMAMCLTLQVNSPWPLELQ